MIALLPVSSCSAWSVPFLTFLVLGTRRLLVRKPRVKVAFEEGPRVAELDPGGEPVYPGRAAPLPARRAGLPVRDGPLRALPRRAGGDLPDVRRSGASALIDTCANCGLVLKVEPRAVAVRTTPGPKPGGAAAA